MGVTDMAHITHFSIGIAALRVTDDSTQSPDYPVRIDMGADVWARMTTDEAVALRDALSRAITESARRHAQAISESEGVQA